MVRPIATTQSNWPDGEKRIAGLKSCATSVRFSPGNDSGVDFVCAAGPESFPTVEYLPTPPNFSTTAQRTFFLGLSSVSTGAAICPVEFLITDAACRVTTAAALSR